MNPDSQTTDPVVTTLLQNPAEDRAHHAEEHAHAFDSPEEVAHAKEHAIQNIWFFVGFFTLILFAVANYELFGVDYWWAVLSLAAIRCLLIAIFLNWLFRGFSLVVRTFMFTILFFAGMVFLSWWDSALKGIGDPIKDRINPPSETHVP